MAALGMGLFLPGTSVLPPKSLASAPVPIGQTLTSRIPFPFLFQPHVAIWRLLVVQVPLALRYRRIDGCGCSWFLKIQSCARRALLCSIIARLKDGFVMDRRARWGKDGLGPKSEGRASQGDSRSRSDEVRGLQGTVVLARLFPAEDEEGHGRGCHHCLMVPTGKPKGE